MTIVSLWKEVQFSPSRCQFHQRSTYSFYAHRSQKRKKDTDDLTVFFTLLGSTSAKAVRSTLMKLTPVQAQNNTARYIYLSSVRIRKPVVNFINILRAHFSYESKLSSFSIVMFQFLYFWRQNISAKCACKMLMKLTPKVDFTNILQEAFYPNFLTPKNYKYKL